MEKEVLEKIKFEYELLRKHAIEYLTTERNVFDESFLQERETYDIFSLFLTIYLPRLYENLKIEASCLPAAITIQMAMSLGWMDSQYNLLSKDFMGIIWGRTDDGGTYTRFTYTKEEQDEIVNYLIKGN